MATSNAVNLKDQGVAYVSSTGTFSNIDGSTVGKVLTSQGTGVSPSFRSLITSPGSSTDRAIATWNSTTAGPLYNNSTVKIDSAGRYLNTTQPVFNIISQTNFGSGAVTGNGTVATLICNTAIINVGTSYNTSNGVFTAPKTGNYFFVTYITLYNLSSSHTDYVISYKNTTTSTTYQVLKINPYALTYSGGYCGTSVSALIPLVAGDNVICTIKVSGGALSVGWYSDTSFNGITYSDGVLIC